MSHGFASVNPDCCLLVSHTMMFLTTAICKAVTACQSPLAAHLRKQGQCQQRMQTNVSNIRWMACRSIGGLERVPLSVLLRRTGSSVSNNGRVSDDATPTPSGPSQGTTTLFTARWPTVRRWGLTCFTYYFTYCFTYGVSAHV